MPGIKYDPEMTKTKHGSRLYAYWRRVHRDQYSREFEEYPDFFNWAMKNGYTVGANLLRYYPDEPFSPDNCFWVPRKDCPAKRDPEWEKKWDENVNRIRLHFGMEPIHSSEG